jgi:hypothetical protein
MDNSSYKYLSQKIQQGEFDPKNGKDGMELLRNAIKPLKRKLSMDQEEILYMELSIRLGKPISQPTV